MSNTDNPWNIQAKCVSYETAKAIEKERQKWPTTPNCPGGKVCGTNINVYFNHDKV